MKNWISNVNGKAVIVSAFTKQEAVESLRNYLDGIGIYGDYVTHELISLNGSVIYSDFWNKSED